MLKPIITVTLGLASIAGLTTYFVKREGKKYQIREAELNAAAKQAAVRRADEAAKHATQMKNDPEYAEVYRKAAIDAAERKVRIDAEREEAVLIANRIYNSPEAVERRERERLIRLEEGLIRERSRERERDLDRMERVIRFNSHCSCDCSC